MDNEEIERLMDESYIRPYGICPKGQEDGLICSIDGTVEFSGEIDGGWKVEENCPECGSTLEIRERVVLETDVELVPDAVVKMARESDITESSEGDQD